jgi:predicted  nucleic acid-binding Zn-ribbon protein
MNPEQMDSLILKVERALEVIRTLKNEKEELISQNKDLEEKVLTLEGDLNSKNTEIQELSSSLSESDGKMNEASEKLSQLMAALGEELGIETLDPFGLSDSLDSETTESESGYESDSTFSLDFSGNLNDSELSDYDREQNRPGY